MENPNSIKQIILTGPESTGKTLLSREIAAQFKVPCFPEYAREYIAALNRPYTYQDLCTIASEQRRQMLSTKESGTALAVFDTYLIITKIWFQVVYKKVPDWIESEIDNTRSNALYLLCQPDIPWQPDKLRENGGEMRDVLYQKYKKELESHKLNYCYIHGSGKERLMNAMRCVEQFI